MEIIIDFSQMPTGNPLLTAWWFITNGLWAVFAIVFIWAIIQGWLIWLRSRYYGRWEWALLSINIPKTNEQYPKAVENIFAALAGTWKHIDWLERFFIGKVQVQFSFEIISRGGYLEYLVHVPRHYRDLAEATIYAQYPDAEISEVPDYTEKFKGVRWPNNDQGYDIWGTEITQLKKYFYPIKTWDQFFDIDKEKGFKDPVYSILENLSKLRQGEEFWFQIVVSPTSNKWKDRGNSFVKGLMDQKRKDKGLGNYIAEGFTDLVSSIVDALVSKGEVEVEEKKGPELTTKESKTIELIQDKLAKIGFRTRIRVVYIARKEVFNKNKVKEGFLGALHQYTDLYSNGFVQDKYSKVSKSHLYYFRAYRVERYRKNHILYNYRTRNMRAGARFGYGFILNVQELASLWHFPLGNVQALMIKKAEFKKAEAPFLLPIKEAEDIIPVGKDSAVQRVEPAEVDIENDYDPPDNLPIM